MHASHRQRNMVLPSIFLVGFMITFGVFVEKLETHKLFAFDFKVIRWIQSKINSRHTRLMKLFTFLGSPIVVSILVLCSAVVLYRSGKRKEAASMLVTNAAGAGFNETLKYIFHRRRPDIHRLITAHGYSFPSGHSMGAVMFYGTLSYFICGWTKSVLCKIIAGITSVFMILITGISRIYLGVHYPSDVIAGFMAGGAWLSVGIHVIDTFLKRHPK